MDTAKKIRKGKCCRDPALDDDKGALHHARNQSPQGRISGAGDKVGCSALALRVGCVASRDWFPPWRLLLQDPFRGRPSVIDQIKQAWLCRCCWHGRRREVGDFAVTCG